MRARTSTADWIGTIRVSWAQVAGLVLSATILVVLVVVLRADALHGGKSLNPDEAELLAAGKRAALSLFTPYGDYTTPTYLPLWPMSLGIFARFGVPMTIPVAHALSAAAYVWMVWVGWVLLARRLGWVFAGALIAPTAVAVLSGPNDFLQLGTELLPLAIIFLAALVLFSADGTLGWRRLALTAFLVGLAPWAKPQSVLLAGSLLLVALALDHARCGEAGVASGVTAVFKRLVLLTAAASAPTVLFVAVMLVRGTFGTFIDEPIDYTLAYFTQRSAISLSDRVVIVHSVLGATNNPLAWLWSVAGLLPWRGGDRGRWTMPKLSVAVWALPPVAAVLTLFTTMPLFQHYVNFLFAGCMLAALAGSAMPRRTVERRARTAPMRRALAVTLVAAASFGVSVRLAGVGLSGDPTLRMPVRDSALTRMCPPGSDVFVWGWAAELYSYQDWFPASRYVVSGWQFMTTPNRHLYGDRLVAELEHRPPSCIVEAIGPAYFAALGPVDSLTSKVPQVEPLLDRCYRAKHVTLASGNVIRAWRRLAICTG